jgi:hypothetical protein
VTSATLLGVFRNPNRFGDGVEVELSLGSTLPVLALGEADGSARVVVGVEGAAFARFGLQVLERELVATDWVFAVPVVWHRERGWVRIRYYHASSHIGDEYSRRFDDRGEDFSRDAAELLGFLRGIEGWALYLGARYAYNVKPEESRRWVLRGGAQWEASERGRALRPFLAGDLEWDQDAGSEVRMDLQAGFWLPQIAGRRSARIALGFLTGPSPLGQFQGGRTTQLSLGLLANL